MQAQASEQFLTPWPVSASLPERVPSTALPCWLPAFHLPTAALAGSMLACHHIAPGPAQFKARFSIKPSPVPTSVSFPCPNLEARGAQGPYLFIHCVFGCIPGACHLSSIMLSRCRHQSEHLALSAALCQETFQAPHMESYI